MNDAVLLLERDVKSVGSEIFAVAICEFAGYVVYHLIGVAEILLTRYEHERIEKIVFEAAVVSL